MKTWSCLNCNAQILAGNGPASLFCSELCKQRADTVRYGRRIFRDGRISEPLVAEAFNIRMAFAVTEVGYPRKPRELDAAIRQAVFDRNQGRCAQCGAPGSVIDHIGNSSSQLINLQ